MRIGFIGVGIVGGATVKMVQDAGHTDLKFLDPGKGMKDSMKDREIVFISVPVPTRTNGEQCTKALREALLMCPDGCSVFVRSSVLPGTASRLQNLMKWTAVHSMPEFLTERQASHDADTLPILASVKGAEILSMVFTSKTIIMVGDETECEFVKYMHNAFCGMKVGFFNTMFNLAKDINLNYDDCVAAACGVTSFIEPTHTKVPGPDGQLGFGGKCLPKDLLALVHYIEKKGQKTFLRGVVEENFINRFGSLF